MVDLRCCDDEGRDGVRGVQSVLSCCSVRGWRLTSIILDAANFCEHTGLVSSDGSGPKCRVAYVRFSPLSEWISYVTPKPRAKLSPILFLMLILSFQRTVIG